MKMITVQKWYTIDEKMPEFELDTQWSKPILLITNLGLTREIKTGIYYKTDQGWGRFVDSSGGSLNDDDIICWSYEVLPDI